MHEMQASEVQRGCPLAEGWRRIAAEKTCATNQSWLLSGKARPGAKRGEPTTGHAPAPLAVRIV